MNKKNDHLIDELSIVIPVYNGERTLNKCLSKIFHQTYFPDRFEVIVVNDGSTDRTEEIVKRFPVRLINSRINQGRIIARNIGVKKSKYRYIYFIDADCELSKTWIKDIINFNYQPIQGQVINTSKYPIDRFFYLLRKRYYRPILCPTFITDENFFRLPKGLGNFLCSKELFNKIKFTKKEEYFSDDQYFISEIGKLKKVLAIPNSIIHHDERESFWNLLIQWFQRGSRFADFYLKKDGLLYKKFNFIVLGAFVVLILFILCPLNIFHWVWFYVVSFFFIYIILVIYFAENLKDIFITSLFLFPIIFTFTLGIIHRKILSWFQ